MYMYRKKTKERQRSMFFKKYITVRWCDRDLLHFPYYSLIFPNLSE